MRNSKVPKYNPRVLQYLHQSNYDSTPFITTLCFLLGRVWRYQRG